MEKWLFRRHALRFFHFSPSLNKARVPRLGPNTLLNVLELDVVGTQPTIRRTALFAIPSRWASGD